MYILFISTHIKNMDILIYHLLRRSYLYTFEQYIGKKFVLLH